MKAYLVWNPDAGQGEGVVFTESREALYASTGRGMSLASGVPTLALEFREIYAYDEPDKVFPIIEIQVPDKEAKCKTVQHGDLTECKTCGLRWDTNDPEPPHCPPRRK